MKTHLTGERKLTPKGLTDASDGNVALKSDASLLEIEGLDLQGRPQEVTLPETSSSPLKIGRAPKGKDRIPTIHFQGLC